MSKRRALRRSLYLGAVYDLLLGLFVLTAGARVLAALGQPLPDRLHFHLALLPLVLLPALYVSAARATDPDPFRPAVLWARTGGGVLILLATALWRPEAVWIYASIGVGDLAWAGVHWGLWRRR
jgi:hypothetical protein